MEELPISTNYLDPPYPETGGGKIKRGADRHFGVIKKKEDILRIIMQSGSWNPADDGHCYIWVTNNYLEWGLWLLGALGYRYVTNLVWVKTRDAWPPKQDTFLQWLKAVIRTGLGQYFRGSHELLLFGVRGRCHKPAAADRWPTSVLHPRVRVQGKQKHSAKPKRFYKIIEATSPGPYKEFFARTQRKGWEKAWGNEV